MPYIQEVDRDKYYKAIRELTFTLRDNDWNPGHVNYVISRLLLNWFNFNKKYSTINSIMGVLNCIGLEFYRKTAADYEDEKEKENGSI